MHIPPLYPFQKQALAALSSHQHVVCVAPTGGGKSRVFQEYILKNPKFRVWIVCPLSALARQHHLALNSLGIQSVLNPNQAALRSGMRVVVMNPERLSFDGARFDFVPPDFLVIDEAHCIWEWGDSFRPAFKPILTWVRDYQIKSSLWLSATLPPDAKRDILHALPSQAKCLGEFALPANLNVKVLRVHPAKRVFELLQLMRAHADGLGIVFIRTRDGTERVAKWLRVLQIPTFVYHAGLSAEERVSLENAIRAAPKGVILATSAFGMGMDIRSMRYVVLFQPPFTLLAVAQALGRAGRDGQQALGQVYWHEDDFLNSDWVTHGSRRRFDELSRVREWCVRGDVGGMKDYFSGT